MSGVKLGTLKAAASGGSGVSPVARTITAGLTANVATLSRLLGSTSVFSIIMGDATISVAGAVSLNTALNDGASITLTAREAYAGLAIEYPVVLTGKLPLVPGVLSIANASALENTGGITFTISRTLGVSGVVGVSWTVNFSGTANASDLSGPVTGTSTLIDGQSSTTITIGLLNDATFEPNETFTVVLSNPTGGAVLGVGTATGTILNDDTPPAGDAFRTVTNLTELNAAITDAPAGAIIDLVPGSYTGQTVTVNKALTLRRQGGEPPLMTIPNVPRGIPAMRQQDTFLSRMDLVGSGDMDFIGLKFICEFWCDTTTGGRWADSDLWRDSTTRDTSNAKPFVDTKTLSVSNYATGRHRFYGCEWSWGYGPTQQPFDISMKYPEFQSGAISGNSVVGYFDPYQSWWLGTDQSNGRAYNTILAGPKPYSGTETMKPPQFYRCYIHDTSTGWSAYHTSGEFVVDQCLAQRVYGDCWNSSLPGNLAMDGTYRVRITRSIVDTLFCHGQDSGNAHGDVHQMFTTRSGPNGQPLKVLGPIMDRFAYFQRPNARTLGGQFIFMQGGGTPGMSFVNPVFRDITGMAGGSDKGISIGKPYDGLVERCMFVGRQGDTTGGGAATINFYPGLPVTYETGLARFRDNIVDALTQNGRFRESKTLLVNRYNTISRADLLATLNTDPNMTLVDLFASSIRKPAYADRGPKYTTLDAFFNEPVSFADIETYVAFNAVAGATKSSTATSRASIIQGPIGETVTIAVDSGEFQIEDVLTGTVLTAWTSSSVTAPIGAAVRLRHTASASPSTSTVQVATLTHAVQGARSFAFTSLTKSDYQYSTVKITAGKRLLSPANAIGAASPKASFAAIIKANDKAAALADFFGGSGIMNRMSFVASTNQFRFYTYEASSGTLIASATSSINPAPPSPGGPFTDRFYALLGSLDNSVVDGVKGAISWAVVDMQTNTIVFTNMQATVATGNNLRMPFQGQIGYTGSGPGTVDMKLYAFASGVAIDLSTVDAINVAMAKLAPDVFGKQGKGFFGKNAELVVTGGAAAFNDAAGVNFGTATGKMIPQTGTAVADVDTVQPWPLPGAISIVASGAPYHPGSPIEITVAENVYLDDHNVTLASDKAGGWDAATKAVVAGDVTKVFTFTPTVVGTHTITVSNTGGYANPTAITLTVS